MFLDPTGSLAFTLWVGWSPFCETNKFVKLETYFKKFRAGVDIMLRGVDKGIKREEIGGVERGKEGYLVFRDGVESEMRD